MYLLDTCTLSDFFAGTGRTQERLRSVSPLQVAISAISVLEIRYGFELNAAANRRYGNSFQKLIETARVIPFERKAAETAASIRAQLKQRGTPIGAWDLLVGATASVHGCILVTSNTREFERIEGLILEDWR